MTWDLARAYDAQRGLCDRCGRALLPSVAPLTQPGGGVLNFHSDHGDPERAICCECATDCTHDADVLKLPER